MSDQTRIEWTDATWNPIRGCSKISPGCTHCYAETFAERFRGVPGHPYEQGFDLRTVPEKLADPLRWRAPRMVFVNSMSDLFHQDVSDDYIRKVVHVMLVANWHTYQVLTKRSVRMRELLETHLRDAAEATQIWWGVSVENRRDGLPRIDDLRAAPAQTRFLSVEPLLEDLGPLDLTGIHWVIVGGESGPGARPMDADWVRSIRDQCRTAGVPFFFKQWGGTRKGKAGRGSTARPMTRSRPRRSLPPLMTRTDDPCWPRSMRGTHEPLLPLHAVWQGLFRGQTSLPAGRHVATDADWSRTSRCPPALGGPPCGTARTMFTRWPKCRPATTRDAGVGPQRFPIPEDRPGSTGAVAAGRPPAGRWRRVLRDFAVESSFLEQEILLLVALSAADLLVTYALLRQGPRSTRLTRSPNGSFSAGTSPG